MKKIIFILISAAVLLTACSSKKTEEGVKTIKVDGGSYFEVTDEKFAEMLKNKDFVLINVHIPYEGNIPGTDLSIPYNEIDQHLAELPAEKDAKIFLYCRSDSMSNTAATTLVGLGYTNVWHLGGGFTDWKAAGYPFEE
jgi:rhodanese-related sulfurtransferase